MAFRRRSAQGAVILAIGVVALAGCGGSSGGKSTVSPGSGGGSTPASAPTSSSSSGSGSGGGYGY
jgi:hypothetical protein